MSELASESLAVDPTVLSGHAETVAGYAAALRDVAGAAQPLDLDAYGRYGQGFAAATAAAAQTAGTAVGRSSDVGDDHARELRATVAAYLLADRDVADLFRRLAAGIPR